MSRPKSRPVVLLCPARPKWLLPHVEHELHVAHMAGNCFNAVDLVRAGLTRAARLIILNDVRSGYDQPSQHQFKNDAGIIAAITLVQSILDVSNQSLARQVCQAVGVRGRTLFSHLEYSIAVARF